MSFFNPFRRRGSAPVARERLQILLSHERAARGQTDLLGILREEILSAIAKHVTQRLRDVGLGEAMDDAPSQLSGGMRKRAGFARALVMEPDIVIFDEPDSGLDPVRTALLCELIQEMHEIYKGTDIVVTRSASTAPRISDAPG